MTECSKRRTMCYYYTRAKDSVFASFERAERYAHSRHGKRLLSYKRRPPDKTQGDFQIKYRYSSTHGLDTKNDHLPTEWHQVCGQLWVLMMWLTAISMSNPTD